MSDYLIGTSGWTNSNWSGKFYPKNLPKKNWLAYYAKHFSTLEINATFYRHFEEKTYLKWYTEVPENFKFILKAPRIITHKKYLKNCETEIQIFSRSANLLKEKLGLILLQLPPNLSYDLALLEKAILAFDNPYKIAIEFRHEKWLNPNAVNLLKNLGCTFCIPDSPEAQLMPYLTSHIGYIRLHGRSEWYKSNYSFEELTEIASFSRKLDLMGADNIYILFNNTYYPYATQNALTLSKILCEKYQSGFF